MGNTRKHRGLLSGKWMLPPPASQVTHSQWPTVTVSDAATAPDFQLFLSGLTLCILLAREWGCSDHRPYSCMPHVPPSDKFSQLQQSEPLIHTVWCLSPKTMKNDRVEPPSSYQIAPSWLPQPSWGRHSWTGLWSVRASRALRRNDSGQRSSWWFLSHWEPLLQWVMLSRQVSCGWPWVICNTKEGKQLFVILPIFIKTAMVQNYCRTMAA